MGRFLRECFQTSPGGRSPSPHSILPATAARRPRDSRAASSSGRRRQVRPSACCSRQRWMRAWSPLSSTSGTARPAPGLGPRVVRPVEQPRTERVLRRRLLIAQHTGHEPRHRIDHNECRELTARQHVIADRDSSSISRSTSRSSKPSYRPATSSSPGSAAMRRTSAAGAAGPAADSAMRLGPAGQAARSRLDGLRERLGLQHHARTAAVGPVVHGAVHIERIRPRILGTDRDQAALDRPAEHAHARSPRAPAPGTASPPRTAAWCHRRQSAGSQSTTTLRAARSTDFKCFGTSGSQCSRSPRTTITGLAGVSTKWSMRPRLSAFAGSPRPDR